MRILMVAGLLLVAGRGPDAAQGLGPQPDSPAARHVTVSEVRLERAATGSYWVRGTVRNSGSRVLDGVYPRVWARFHGPDGALLFEDYDYLATALPSGQRRSFDILLLAPHVAAGWVYYELGFTVDDDRPIRCVGCEERRREP